MLDSRKNPIKIMIFGLKLSNALGYMCAYELLFSILSEHMYLNMTKRSFRKIALELVHFLDILLGKLKNPSPHSLTSRRGNSG